MVALREEMKVDLLVVLMVVGKVVEMVRQLVMK
jgi:hypothetical protein